ncbi:MAG: OmpA family protein [Thermoanaerobaculia bacterium]|nr:MAG: OmpA family protein [Thermoanaerobaculia bacterium]MBZ0103951.1 OmpA family protein [Thermoanaerobaculia bacterium]
MKRNVKTLAIAAAAAVALVSTGCATKKYVKGEVSTVNERVDGVQGQVEEAQTTLRDHDGRITRNEAATAEASKTAREALDRAVAAGKLAEGKLLYETVLSDDKVKFGFDQANLSDDARAALDAFAAQLKTENKNVYVEIQGHTDNVGGESYNEKLGAQRAAAVKEYLAKQGIPLFRMETISYGEAAPVADNGSREGRAQNRRVVLVVLQ